MVVMLVLYGRNVSSLQLQCRQPCRPHLISAVPLHALPPLAVARASEVSRPSRDKGEGDDAVEACSMRQCVRVRALVVASHIAGGVHVSHVNVSHVNVSHVNVSHVHVY